MDRVTASSANRVKTTPRPGSSPAIRPASPGASQSRPGSPAMRRILHPKPVRPIPSIRRIPVDSSRLSPNRTRSQSSTRNNRRNSEPTVPSQAKGGVSPPKAVRARPTPQKIFRRSSGWLRSTSVGRTGTIVKFPRLSEASSLRKHLASALRHPKRLLVIGFAIFAVLVMLAPSYAELAAPGGPLYISPEQYANRQVETKHAEESLRPPEQRDIYSGSYLPESSRPVSLEDLPPEERGSVGRPVPVDDLDLDQESQSGDRPRDRQPGSSPKPPKTGDTPVVNSGDAVWNAAIQAFECASETLTDCQTPYSNDNIANSGVEGRDAIGPEPNNPSTLYDSCLDGGSGFYLSDESIEQVVVSSSDGSFNLGETATVSIRAYVFSAANDHYSVWYTSNANQNPPTWTQVGGDVHFTATGLQYKSGAATLTLTGSNGRHAVRVVQHYHTPEPLAVSCESTSYSDNDDLVFQVGTPPPPPPGQAVFSSPLQAFECSDSAVIECFTEYTNDNFANRGVEGRNGIGPEPNNPSTLYDSCADGGIGTYQFDESIEQIKVANVDAMFNPGDSVTITVRAYVYSSTFDHYWIWYTNNANVNPPQWTRIGGDFHFAAGGKQVTAFVTFTLTGGAGRHAVRVVQDYSTSEPTPVFCNTASYGDNDDLVFAVANGAPSTPAQVSPFDNSRGGETGLLPRLRFASTDPEGDRVRYQVQVSEDPAFGTLTIDASSASTTNGCGFGTEFCNTQNLGEADPFTSGQTVEFKALTDLVSGTTYWWRVRATDPLGSNSYSLWTSARSLTVDDTIPIVTWYQTTKPQFDTDSLSGAVTSTFGAGAVELTGGIYFSDSFSDNDYLSNPAWTGQTSGWSAATGALESTGSTVDRISTPLSLSLSSYQVTWSFTWRHEAADSAQSQIRFYLVSTGASVDAATGVNGYYFTANSAGTPTSAYLGIVRQNGASTSFVLGGSPGNWAGGTGWNTASITRTTGGVFTVTINGLFFGSFTDTTYQSGSHIGLRNTAANTLHNAFIDDIVVSASVSGSITSTGIAFADHPQGTSGWKIASWSRQLGTSGAVTVAVQKFSGGSWIWTGIQSAASATSLDISSLGTTASIRLLGNMSTAGDVTRLLDWQATWSDVSPPSPPVQISPFDDQRGGAGGLRPVFRFSATDPEGSDIRYQIQIGVEPTLSTTIVDRTSSPGNSGPESSQEFGNSVAPDDTEPFNSADTAEYRLQTDLTNGATYWWRVRATDPTGSGLQSAWSLVRAFTVDTALPVPVWSQTTQDQFARDTLVSVGTTGTGGGAVELIGNLLQDSFSDNEFATNPMWTPQGGTQWTAAGGSLENLGTVEDRVSTPLNLNLGAQPTTWEFLWRHEAADQGRSQMRLYMTSSSASVTPATGVNGYYFTANSDTGPSPEAPYVGLVRQDGSITNFIIGGEFGNFAGGTGWHQGKVTRTLSGQWEIFVDGVSKGTVGDTTYTAGSFVGLRNTGDGGHNVLVDDIIVTATLSGSITGRAILFSDGPEAKVSWKSVTWTEQETGAGTVSILVEKNSAEDCSGAWSQAMPPTVTPPIDLTPLTQEPCIRLGAQLAVAGGTAQLLDWSVEWRIDDDVIGSVLTAPGAAPPMSYANQRRTFWADGAYFSFFGATDPGGLLKVYYVSSRGPVARVDVSTNPSNPAGQWIWSGRIEVPFPTPTAGLSPQQIDDKMGFTVDERGGHAFVGWGMKSASGDSLLGMSHGLVTGDTIAWKKSITLDHTTGCASGATKRIDGNAPISGVIGTDLTLWLAASAHDLGHSICLFRSSPELDLSQVAVIDYGVDKTKLASTSRVTALAALPGGEVILGWWSDGEAVIRWTRAGGFTWCDSSKCARTEGTTDRGGGGTAKKAPCRAAAWATIHGPCAFGGHIALFSDDLLAPSSTMHRKTFSAVATSGGVTYFSYARPELGYAGGVVHGRVLRVDADDDGIIVCLAYSKVVPAGPRCPGGTTGVPTAEQIKHMSLAVDTGGALSVFFSRTGGAGIIHYRQMRLTDAWDVKSLSSGSPAGYLTAARLTTANGYVPVQWIDTSDSLRYSSLPHPNEILSSPGKPWARQGQSPAQTYMGGKNELVSPGSGLLTVSQLDFSQAGRGLDPVMARIYITPRIFPQRSQEPYYDMVTRARPIAGLGNSFWRIDLPQLIQDYVVLSGGSAYMVKWRSVGENVDPFRLLFENFDGTPFRLWTPVTVDCAGVVPDPNDPNKANNIAAKLDLPDGTCWEFNAAGMPVRQTDNAGNFLVYCYRSPGKPGHCNDPLQTDPTDGHLVRIIEFARRVGMGFWREYNFIYDTLSPFALKFVERTDSESILFGRPARLLLCYDYDSQGRLSEVRQYTDDSTVPSNQCRDRSFGKYVFTKYFYESEQALNSPRLIGIQYPTGGRTFYNYASVSIGATSPSGKPDLVSYVVTKQTTSDRNGAFIRSREYSYEMVDGWAIRSKVEEFKAGEVNSNPINAASLSDGSTVSFYDSARAVQRMERYDAAGTLVMTQSMYLNERGHPERTEQTAGPLQPSLVGGQGGLCSVVNNADAVCSILIPETPGKTTMARVHLKLNTDASFNAAALELRLRHQGREVTLTQRGQVTTGDFEKWYDMLNTFDELAPNLGWDLILDYDSGGSGGCTSAPRACLESWAIEVFYAEQRENPLLAHQEADTTIASGNTNACAVPIVVPDREGIISFARVRVDIDVTAVSGGQPVDLRIELFRGLTFCPVGPGTGLVLQDFGPTFSSVHRWYSLPIQLDGQTPGDTWRLKVTKGSGHYSTQFDIRFWGIEFELLWKSEGMTFDESPEGFAAPEDLTGPSFVRWEAPLALPGDGNLRVLVSCTDLSDPFMIRRVTPLTDRSGFHMESTMKILRRDRSTVVKFALEGEALAPGYPANALEVLASITPSADRLSVNFRGLSGEMILQDAELVSIGGGLGFYRILIDYVAMTGELVVTIKDSAGSVLGAPVSAPLFSRVGEHFLFERLRISPTTSTQCFLVPGFVTEVLFDSMTIASAPLPITLASEARSDRYGNTFYRRESEGQESFESFWNPDSVDEFRFPGRASRVASGQLASESFTPKEIDLNVWGLDGNAANRMARTEGGRLVLSGQTVSSGQDDHTWLWKKDTVALPVTIDARVMAAAGVGPSVPPPPTPTGASIQTSLILSPFPPQRLGDDLRLYSDYLALHINAIQPERTKVLVTTRSGGGPEDTTTVSSDTKGRAATWRVEIEQSVSTFMLRVFSDIGDGAKAVSLSGGTPAFITRGDPIYIYLMVSENGIIAPGTPFEGAFDYLLVQRHHAAKVVNVPAGHGVWLEDVRGQAAEKRTGGSGSVQIPLTSVGGLAGTVRLVNEQGLRVVGSDVHDLTGGDLLIGEGEDDLTDALTFDTANVGGTQVQKTGYTLCDDTWATSSCTLILNEEFLPQPAPAQPTGSKQCFKEGDAAPATCSWPWVTSAGDARKDSMFHRSGAYPGVNWHRYVFSSPSIPVDSTDVIVQYIRLSVPQIPSQIAMAFHEDTPACRALPINNCWKVVFWNGFPDENQYGLFHQSVFDSTSFKDLGGLSPAPSFSIGPLGSTTKVGEWMALAVPLRVLSPSGPFAMQIDGVAFGIIGGALDWDFTMVLEGSGQWNKGFTVSGQDGDVVRAYGEDGCFRGEVVVNSGRANLDLLERPVLTRSTCRFDNYHFYHRDNAEVNLPFRGWIEIRRSDDLLYRTPVRDVWLGDQFVYDHSANLFCPNQCAKGNKLAPPNIPTEYSVFAPSLALGTLQLQEDRVPGLPAMQQPGRVETYVHFKDFDPGDADSRPLPRMLPVEYRHVHRDPGIVYRRMLVEYGTDGSFGRPVALEDNSGVPPHRVEITHDSTGLFIFAEASRTCKASPQPPNTQACDPFNSIGAFSTYDFPSGLLVSERDSNGERETLYTYDLLGRTTNVVSQPVVGSTPRRTTTYSYADDASSILVTGDLVPVRQNYDGIGRVFSIDRLDSRTSPMEVYSSENYGLDGADRTVRVTYTKGPTLADVVTHRQLFDSIGRQAQLINPDGSSWRVLYDDTERLVRHVSEAGRVTEHVTDKSGRGIWGRQYLQPVGTIGAGPYASSHTAYDNVGNPTMTADPLDRKTRTVYDDFGKVSMMIFPDGTKYSYTYLLNEGLPATKSMFDAQGNLIRRFAYNYDDLMRLTSLVAEEPRTATTSECSRTEYILNKNGLPKEVKSKSAISAPVDCPNSGLTLDSTLTYTFDILDRVKSETLVVRPGTPSEHSRFVTFGYDSHGNPISQGYPARPQGLAGLSFAYSYDQYDRLEKVRESSAAYEYALVSYNRDDTLSQVSYTTKNTGAELGRMSYAYNERGWPTRIEGRGSGALIRFAADYSYDTSGLLLGMADSVPGKNRDMSYVHDGMGRLTKADDSVQTPTLIDFKYDYDLAGNILSICRGRDELGGSVCQSETRYVYDTAPGSGFVARTQDYTNQVLTSETSYEDDLFGRMTQKCVPVGTCSSAATGTVHSYSYNALDQLTQYRNGPSIAGLVDDSIYLYDGNGRRVETTRTISGGAAVARNFYSGLSLLHEETTVPSPQLGDPLSTDYVYANRQAFMEIRTSNQAPNDIEERFYLTDLLGSVRVVIGSGGLDEEALAYDPFGNLELHSTQGGRDVRFKYAGEVRDSELIGGQPKGTGFDNLWSRNYDPALGRFISRDNEIGDSSFAQSMNRYSYVYNSPLIHTDPTGRVAWAVIFAVILLGALIGGILGVVHCQSTQGSGAGCGKAFLAGMILGGTFAAGFFVGGGILGVLAMGILGFAEGAAFYTFSTPRSQWNANDMFAQAFVWGALAASGAAIGLVASRLIGFAKTASNIRRATTAAQSANAATRLEGHVGLRYADQLVRFKETRWSRGLKVAGIDVELRHVIIEVTTGENAKVWQLAHFARPGVNPMGKTVIVFGRNLARESAIQYERRGAYLATDAEALDALVYFLSRGR